MNTKKIILFKINNEVVVEEKEDLFLNQVDEMKWAVALEFKVGFDEVVVEVVDEKELSDMVDVTPLGMVFWKALYHEPIKGVYCDLVEGSDEYLDAMNDGTLTEHLNFFIK